MGRKKPVRDQEVIEGRVAAVTAQLEAEFDLGWLVITHRFNETSNADRVVAETIADWEYRQASIHWYLPVVANLSDEELLETAIHEYVHVLLGPIYDVLPEREGIDKLNEFTTQSLTRAIVAMRRNHAS
jgi:hypothetical protein